MSSLAAVALVGALIIALGSVIAAFRGLLRTGLFFQAAGTTVLGVVGLLALLGSKHAGSPFHNAVSPALGIDPFTGFFLVVLAMTAVPTLIYARDYLPGSNGDRIVAALTGGFMLSLVGVLTARDLTTFLGFWELMTLLPAAAIIAARRDVEVRGAVYAYMAITHLGGAGVWIALLVLQHHGAFGDPAALAAAGTGTQTLVAIAALIGFGTKAGFVPLHSWLPRAHPVAPSHLSALMSGMMLKVALYGLIRVEFQWLGSTPRWLGIVLLAFGAASSFGGLLWALVQHELKRMLAYSSIENVGIIALGLGSSLLLGDAGQRTWAAIAFAAALLQIANHATFKTLLFLGAGAIQKAVGSLDLDHLGGLLRRMPWTGAAFMVGALSVAGLPFFNGFASEWLTLESLLHTALNRPVAVALAAALALAILAATAASAVLGFVKIIGLTLLGQPRRKECAEAVDPPAGMRLSMAFLALLCIALGLVPGLVLPTLIGLAPGAAHTGIGRHISLSLPLTGNYPTLWVAVALVLLTGALSWWRGSRRAAKAPTWASGQPIVLSLGWTSAGFTTSARLAFKRVLRLDRKFDVRRSGGMIQEINYSGVVPPLADRWLYQPTIRTALRFAKVARRLQSGNIRTYATYLLGLLLVLLVLTRVGAF